MNGFTDDELRMIGVGGPLWLKMLRAREARLISRMHGEFRNGKIDQLPFIAELAVLRDIIHEIESALRLNKGD